VTGVTLDPSGFILPGVSIRLSPHHALDPKSSVSDEHGSFSFPSLGPGTYKLEATKTGFKPVIITNLQVHVTEILRLELHLAITGPVEVMQVSSNMPMVQLDNSALGRVVNTKALNDLPLGNRNFTQITGLSPGVFAAVYNAGELGIGGTALSQVGKSNDGIYVHGARSYDNNWQLDGISVSDVLSSGSASGGIPVPNPDTLDEFKVQTGLYSAAYGRGTGGNISVITKTGGNEFHGSVFEFLRNNILNGNDFFLNEFRAERIVAVIGQFSDREPKSSFPKSSLSSFTTRS
jgi:hypothetical protein